MWELDYNESWPPKNWCFWTVVLEKTLESPLGCKEIKPVPPKEINPEYSLERLMLDLNLQYFEHLMWRTDSFEKTLMLGKIEGGSRRGRQRMRWLDYMADSMDMSLSVSGRWWRTGKPRVLPSMGSQRVRHDWATEQQLRSTWHRSAVMLQRPASGLTQALPTVPSHPPFVLPVPTGALEFPVFWAWR